MTWRAAIIEIIIIVSFKEPLQRFSVYVLELIWKCLKALVSGLK